MTKLLAGKKGLVVGISNLDSIAWGCAQTFYEHGAELAVTYLNEKSEPAVYALAKKVKAPIFMKLDVTSKEEQELLFAEITNKWGKLDFLLHSIAYAPKIDLQGRVVDCSSEGFSKAMDISCHSLMRLIKSAEPMMKEGGSIITISFYGAKKVLNNYNLMGPVKAALETSVEYLAAELGVNNIRVNALSTGPVKTKAASGLLDFDLLMDDATQKSPLHQLISLKQIGEMASFLVSENASQVTGQVIYVDAGYNIKG